MPERILKITCDECGYSEKVPHPRLPYEEGKTCPSCREGKMWWVPLAEEARRKEVRRMMAMPEERRISPVAIIPIGLGLGLAAVVGLFALARAAAPPEEGPPEEGPPVRFFVPPEMTKKLTDGTILDMYWNCEVWCDITNNGDAPGTHNVHIWDSVGNVDFTMEVTLQPGETYTWYRAQWIDFRRIDSYSVHLQGDWEENNYSVATFP